MSETDSLLPAVTVRSPHRPRCSSAGIERLTQSERQIIDARTSLSSSSDDLSSKGEHCHAIRNKAEIDKKARNRLILASVLCLLFMVAEIVGGVIAGSLAIVSDAAHLLTDFASFMVSLLALLLASRQPTRKMSFGWYRAEILGALLSILLLWVLTGIIVYMAIQRIIEDSYDINATVMLVVAACGVAFNLFMGLTLHQHSHGHSHGSNGSDSNDSRHSDSFSSNNVSQYQSINNTDSVIGMDHTNTDCNHSNSNNSHGPLDGSHGNISEQYKKDNSDIERSSTNSEPVSSHGHHHHGNINVRAAFIHVMGDLLQSIGVLIAAIIIYFKPEWKMADPICTFVFSVIVMVTTITVVRDILVVLMEGTPRGLNFIEVKDSLYSIPGVRELHDLRMWSLSLNKIALAVHIAVDKDTDPLKVLRLASVMIQKRYGIADTTIQVEEYIDEMETCSHCQDLPK